MNCYIAQQGPRTYMEIQHALFGVKQFEKIEKFFVTRVLHLTRGSIAINAAAFKYHEHTMN